MHFYDAKWLGLVNPKEENNASVKSICAKILLKLGEELLFFMLPYCGYLVVARVFLIFLINMFTCI